MMEAMVLFSFARWRSIFRIEQIAEELLQDAQSDQRILRIWLITYGIGVFPAACQES
jgi:hypothetical protein